MAAWETAESVAQFRLIGLSADLESRQAQWRVYSTGHWDTPRDDICQGHQYTTSQFERERQDYRPDEDRFPPNNRTLANFYTGAWAYNVHNSWLRHPEPSSWLSVIQKAHDGFFAGEKLNMYSEKWSGPDLMPYYYWPEYL